MSRKAILLIGSLLCVAVAGSVLAAAGRISVYVDGRPVQAQAIVRDGVTYLPVRAVAEALGVSVQYDSGARAVYIQRGGAGVSVVPPPAAPAPTYRAPAATERGTDIVHITRTGAKYHRAGCRYLARSDIPISRKDAEARGYTPCSVCRP
jgi:hypothetical protein